MTEYIVKVENLAKMRKLAGLHVKETIELTSGKIVRCRDCKHYEKLSDDKGVCHPLGIVFADMDDGFCAWAERKEGGE